ncbi:peptidase domain-containing ABC transporter [Gemmatimonas groenlandica]|uniref:ABC transporter ATP-binding protein n=1 Tax=Gemmatimonas groenlandica TaxID=2732249 RepID=A0A6M4ILQ1_9BACT|nr:ABC transporter ATP-binding protein [Gemmatimonas groenlandica]QJR34336.1 ABC transporter ATP-binding protein [Gemmatimonas groenlandica]
MSAQATRVNQLVTAALGLDVEQARWRALTRQILSTDPLPNRLRSIGGAVDVGYLDRQISLDTLKLAIGERTVPIVLLDLRNDDAIVMCRDADDRVQALLVPRDGSEVVIDGQGDALAETLFARMGSGNALAALAPMALRPANSSLSNAYPHSPVGETGRNDEHEPRTPIDRTLALFARERREILTVFFYATLSGGLSLILPLAVGGIVQIVQGRLYLQPVIVLISFVVLGTIVAGVLQIGILNVVERIQQRVFARMALEFAFRIPRLRYAASLEQNLPEQMNRLFEAIAIQKGVQKLLLDVPTALLTIVFSLLLLTVYSPWFSVFAIGVTAALWFIIRWSGPEGLETSIVESKYKYKAVHWLEEIARAFHAFKYAGDSTLPVERMDDVVTGYLKYRRKHFAILVKQTIALIGFKTFITAAVLIIGATLVQSNRLLLGQFVAAEVVIVTVLAGVEKLINSIATVYDVLTSVDKSGHVADLPLEARGGLAPIHTPGVGVSIVTKDLRYRYPSARSASVDGVTVQIAPGERVAIMGSDGSGQSTLLKLLGGLIDDYDGTIRFDGVTLRDLDRPALRARIGQMLSWTDLFDGTVEENVSVGRTHITPRDVREALDDLALTDEIQQLPQGIQTELTNGGRTLPAHLASKLLVAQGMVGRPRLIVLDDFFQNLDAASRTLIIKLLTDRNRPWTVITVSHDPQLLEAFDRVLVVEDGQVVREGPFSVVRMDPMCLNLLHETPMTTGA